jgi:hypothetical protein
MNFKTFIVGLLILILTPILVIGAFAAYTYWANARPQAGLLHCRVEPQVVFKGDEVTYTMSFLGEDATRPEGKPAPPVDMVFVVDTSGSMHSSLSDMTQAARTVAHEIATAYPSGHIRFALTQFHDSSEIKAGWTPDSNTLYAGLNRLDKRSGNSGTADAFPPIRQLLSQARPNATKVVVFYTDGHIGVDDAIANMAETLRKQGVHIFSISPPGYDTEAMYLITGDWDRVLEPINLQDLVNKFRFVADTVIGLYGNNAQLTHQLDSRNFTVPIEDSEWRTDNTGNLVRDIGYLAFKSVDYQHTLIPKTTGLWWSVGLAPPSMSFITPQNELGNMNCERRPTLLVLSIWWLILAFLPALLWLLFFIGQRITPKPKPEYIPPAIRTPAPPSPLPLPSVLALARKTVVPTLFIGLGGAGRQALFAIQEQLRAAHLDAKNQPYRFLWLDLDASLPQNEPELLTQRGFDNVRELVAPKDIRQAAQYRPLPNQPLPAQLKWFNPRDYLDAARNELELSTGANGRRVLARLALFQWLNQGQLVTALKEEYQALLKNTSVDDNRQIILFAERTGGVGCGWIVDIARLFRRMARQAQQSRQQFVPEIIGVLSSTPHYQQSLQQQQNRQALDKEIETAQMAGAFPQRVTYRPNDELLDKTDTESPFNWLFSVTGQAPALAAIQSAALSAILVERYPRWTLLSHDKGQCFSVQAQGIHVMPDLDYQLVKREVLLRLLGAEVLLDLELDPASQKLVVKPVSDSEAEKLLIQWNRNEQPKGTPWQLLLYSVVGLEGSAQFFAVMAEKGHPDLVWFQQALVASLTRQLRGHRSDDGRWVRTWMPGEAVAALRLFAERLEQRVKPQVPPGKNGKILTEIVTQVIDLTRSAATQLQHWLTEFAPLYEEIGQQQRQFAQQRDTAQNQDGQVFIDESADDKRIVQWANQALQQWVGSVDITSALCERLFFTARLDKNDVVIVLAAYIENRHEFSSAQAAKERLESYTDTAAQQVPTLKIEGALAHLEVQKLQQLTRNMVDAEHNAEQVVMVMPTVADNSEMAPVLTAFRKMVPEPAGQAQAQYCYGDDHSAIRRLELQTERLPDAPGNLPFVQAAEQAAEEVRQRAIHQFETELPIFPPALRIALSHPAAFRSFSRAYKAGHIVKPDTARDERGIVQWVFGEQFLTFGDANSLADAAANYSYLIKNPPTTFTEREQQGDFSNLEAWKASGGLPEDEDVFVLAAMTIED